MKQNSIRSLELPNKLKVILDYQPYARSVSLGFQVGCGSFTENPENMGFSHLVEHLVFKGTKKRDYLQINKDIEKYGGYLNAFTDKRYTFFYVKILPEYVVYALDVLADIVFSPTFPEEEIEKEKNVILEEISSYEDNPEELLADLFLENCYPDSFLGMPILGKIETIAAAKREKIVAYWKRFYKTSNIIFSISGSFEEKEVLEFLSSLPDNTENDNLLEDNSFPHFSYRFQCREKQVEQVHLALGMETMTIFHEQRFVLSLLNNILGNSASSRLYVNIREKLGLCYSIGTSLLLDAKTGVFSIFTSTHPKNIQKMIDAILKEIKNIGNQPIQEEEIKIAKAQVKSHILFNLEDTSYRMQKNAQIFFWYKQIMDFYEIIDKINKITREEIFSVYYNFFEKQKQMAGFAIVPSYAKKNMPKQITME